jgi:hypothetical protein
MLGSDKLWSTLIITGTREPYDIGEDRWFSRKKWKQILTSDHRNPCRWTVTVRYDRLLAVTPLVSWRSLPKLPSIRLTNIPKLYLLYCSEYRSIISYIKYVGYLHLSSDGWPQIAAEPCSPPRYSARHATACLGLHHLIY